MESRQGNHEPGGSARDRAPAPPHQRIGELVAAITHDLRQPMTAVELNVAAALHLLRLREPRTSDAVAALVDAQQQHHRLKDAVRAMHSLLEPRAPFQASVDAVAIAWEVVRLAGLEARSPSVSLRLMIAPPIPVVAADAVMMREALVIIVLGALEAAARRASSGAVVTVELRHVAANVEIVVTHPGTRPTAALLDTWAQTAARAVGAANAATVTVEETGTNDVRIVTRWPEGSDPETPSTTSDGPHAPSL